MSNATAQRQLEAWIKQIGKMASGEDMRELSDLFQDDTLDLLEEQFEKGIGPNGIPYAKKKQPDGQKPLTRTGELKRSFRAERGDRRGFTISSSKMEEYGKYHQKGRKRPWKIKPKNKSLLKFYPNPIPSKAVFAKEVEHPGYPARPIYPSKILPKRYADRYTATARKFWRKKGFKF